MLQVAPYEICRIDKNEGSAAVSMEEDVEDLNQEMNEFEKHSSQKGKVKPTFSLSLPLMQIRNSIQLFLRENFKIFRYHETEKLVANHVK